MFHNDSATTKIAVTDIQLQPNNLAMIMPSMQWSHKFLLLSLFIITGQRIITNS